MQTTDVLILSQYAILRSALRHMLSSAPDIQIIGEAEFSADIANIIRERRPTLVLIETEDYDAHVAEVVKSVAEAGVPFVVLANEGRLRAIRAMMKAGGTGYVLKHSTDTELFSALRSAAFGRKYLDSSLIDTLASENVESRFGASTPALSMRQREVLRYLVQGYTNREIARRLGLSIKTVETYRSRLYDSLEVRGRAGLMQYALANGLISVRDLE